MPDQPIALALERFTSFGDLLKFLRRREGLTQRELSISVGYSHAQVSRLELNQRPPDLATVTARFIPALSLDRSPEAAVRLVELAALPHVTEPAPGNPPFKGLRSFAESDADQFFGREALTAKLLERIRETPSDLRFLAVVGASGIGKSSIVQAGLIPVLRRERGFRAWQIRSFTPTAHPLQALAEALTPPEGSLAAMASLLDDLAAEPRALHLLAGRELARQEPGSTSQRPPGGSPSKLLLIVDQLEELFSLCRAEAERQAFIDNLMTAVTEPDGPVNLVLTLRADFYNYCAPYALLREALAERQEYIGPMTVDELRRAIEEPARGGNWELEPGLVDVLLQDIGAGGQFAPEPGAMPLLSHALLETWQRRRGRTLTVSGYLASGGVSGAIAETADVVFYDELDEDQQQIARNVLLRLTQLGEDETMVETRRRVGFDELISGSPEPAKTREVLTILADARLITTDNDVAEVAHEALIREWPTLRGWIEEDREGLRLHRHLTLAAGAWERRGRDPGELYRGARLAQALAWAEGRSDRLSGLERVFLAESRDLERKTEAELEAAHQRELQVARALTQTQAEAAQQLRRRALYLGAAFLLTLAMTAIALFFGDQARRTAVTAQHQQRVATARELSAAAINNLEIDPERSILLALQAVATTRGVDGVVLPEAEEALHRSIIASPVRQAFTGHGTRVLSAAYNPDGTRLATIGDDGTTIVWNPSTGEEQLRLPGTTEPSDVVTDQRVAYDSTGSLLAAADDRLVRLYDASTGDLILTLDGHATDVTAVAFNRDGDRIASGALDGTVSIWDATEGTRLATMAAHADAIEGLTFTPDGLRLITGGSDAALRFWDAQTGALLREDTDFDAEVIGPVFSSNGSLFGFAASGEAHLWRLGFVNDESGTQVTHAEVLSIPESGVVKFSPDGKLLATVSGNEISIRESATGQELQRLLGHTGWVMGVEFSPDGTSLVTTSLDGSVRIWDLGPGGEIVAVLVPAAAYGTRVAFSPDGRYIATNAGDGTATLMDAASGEMRQIFAGHDLEVLNIAFSADGDRLATASLDGTAIVWETSTGNRLVTLKGHEIGVRDIAFSPDGRRIATGSFDNTARIWDASTGEELHTITGHDGLVLGVAFSPDGSLLATSSTDGTAKIWDAETAQLLRTLEGHEGGIPDIVFSPDGSKLATGSVDTTVRLWDPLTGAELRSLESHDAGVFSVSFSPDGDWLGSGSADNTAKVWSVVSGQEVLTLPGSSGGVFGVSFDPLVAQAHLAVASNDGLVRVFLTRIDDLLALANSRVTRSLSEPECQKFLHLERCPPSGP
jgi:WD40 repeat protein